MYDLAYCPLERVPVGKPFNRIGFIKERCKGKVVLDLGSYDETALNKQKTSYWLFGEISEVTDTLIGIDNSMSLPDIGIVINEHARIIKGEIQKFNYKQLSTISFEIIIAGELIEHLPDTISFLKRMRKEFPGKKMICTTPNATSISNIILSLFKRESTHIDHKQIYSFKTLNSICRHAEFKTWRIIPYYVKYTEMILNSGPFKRPFIKLAEYFINLLEFLFPLQSGGFILEIDL